MPSSRDSTEEQSSNSSLLSFHQPRTRSALKQKLRQKRVLNMLSRNGCPKTVFLSKLGLISVDLWRSSEPGGNSTAEADGAEALDDSLCSSENDAKRSKSVSSNRETLQLSALTIDLSPKHEKALRSCKPVRVVLHRLKSEQLSAHSTVRQTVPTTEDEMPSFACSDISVFTSRLTDYQISQYQQLKTLRVIV